jgi:hypothetical protein
LPGTHHGNSQDLPDYFRNLKTLPKSRDPPPDAAL